MCNESKEIEDFKNEESVVSPEMHVHLFIFTTEMIDVEAAICRRAIDSYHYVGTELDFFEEMMEMPDKDKWRRQVESAIKGMTLRAQMNGQRGATVYSLKVNIDEEQMKSIMHNNVEWIQDLCKKSGVKIS